MKLVSRSLSLAISLLAVAACSSTTGGSSSGSSGSSGTGGPNGSSGSGGTSGKPGGTSGTPATSGGTTSGQGKVCAPPKDTCQKCIGDRCATTCSTCESGAACVQAWDDFAKCTAHLGPGKSCVNDPECGGAACKDGHCPVSDATCLPHLRNEATASALYDCLVGGVQPCSDTPECADPQPL